MANIDGGDSMLRADPGLHGTDRRSSSVWQPRHRAFGAAEKIAHDAVTNRLSKVLTCDPAAAAGEQACAATFISSFGGKAFRRPVDAAQTQALMSIWQVGRDTGGDFKSGVEAVITAV